MQQASKELAEKIKEIVYSKEGMAAAIEATKAGFAALQGVDPILKTKLGAGYTGENGATLEAGFWIDKMMGSKGYVASHRGGLPSSCVAKTALVFVPNSKFASK